MFADCALCAAGLTLHLPLCFQPASQAGFIFLSSGCPIAENKLDLLEDSPGPGRYDVPQLRCIVAINPDQGEEAGVTVMPQMLLPA